MEYIRDLARVAYEAYAEHRDWKAFNNQPIPDWTEVIPEVKEAWEVAVLAAIKANYSHQE